MVIHVIDLPLANHANNCASLSLTILTIRIETSNKESDSKKAIPSRSSN